MEITVQATESFCTYIVRENQPLKKDMKYIIQIKYMFTKMSFIKKNCQKS